MEWISKFISTLKIPLKILISTFWIFSGALLLLPNTILEKLNLFNWSNKNGFTFGLIFLITSCLIIVYFLYFIKDILVKFTQNKLQNKRTLKKLFKVSKKEKEIILMMYHSDGFSSTIDYADPIVKSLIARKFIYLGNNASVIPDWDDKLWVRGVLQPFVWQSLNWFYERNHKKILKLTEKLSKEKNNDKRIKLQNKLHECEQIEQNLRR